MPVKLGHYTSKHIRLTGMSTTAFRCPKCLRGHSGGVGKNMPHTVALMLHNKYLREPDVLALECPCCGYAEIMNMTPINYKLNTAERVFDRYLTKYKRLQDLSFKLERKSGTIDPATGVPLPRARRI